MASASPQPIEPAEARRRRSVALGLARAVGFVGRVEYRHVIGWLVRKPGAFADYRYRADLFPSSQFRLAYDTLQEQQPLRAVKEYLGILYLAARQGEAGVTAANGAASAHASSVASRRRPSPSPRRPLPLISVPC